MTSIRMPRTARGATAFGRKRLRALAARAFESYLDKGSNVDKIVPNGVLSLAEVD